MRMLRAAALGAALFLVILPVAAFAQAAAGSAVVVPSDSTVVVPYGDLTDQLLAWLGRPDGIVWTIAGLVATWIMAQLPKPTQVLFRTIRFEQLMDRAVAYGFNAARGAVRGKTLSVDVGANVIAEAANYALRYGSAHLIEWAGGVEAIAEKAIARVTLDENATAQEVLATARAKPMLKQHVKPLFPR